MSAKILVVDDSRFSRKASLKALASMDVESKGFETIEAENGKLALDAVQEHHPVLVVSDLLMPEMDGQTFLKELRASGSEIPVVIASADIQESSRQECEAHGIHGFLNKPYTKEQFAEIVSPILEKVIEEVPA